jgi:hypothetical protein
MPRWWRLLPDLRQRRAPENPLLGSCAACGAFVAAIISCSIESTTKQSGLRLPESGIEAMSTAAKRRKPGYETESTSCNCDAVTKCRRRLRSGFMRRPKKRSANSPSRVETNPMASEKQSPSSLSADSAVTWSQRRSVTLGSGRLCPFGRVERKKANIRALLAASNRRDSSGSLMFNSDLL